MRPGHSRFVYVPQDDVFPAGQSVREVVLNRLAEDSTEGHGAETQANIALTRTGFNRSGSACRRALGQLGGSNWPWRARGTASARFAVAGRTYESSQSLPGIRLARATPAKQPIFGYVVATHDRAFCVRASPMKSLKSTGPIRRFFRTPRNYEVFI